MYKKVVVVVNEKEIYFTGYEGLTIINKGKNPVSFKAMQVSQGFGVYDEDALLILRATIEGKIDAVIAVFKKWDYWRDIQEPENSNNIVGYYLVHGLRIPLRQKDIDRNHDIMKDINCFIGPHRVKELETEWKP